jgi:acylphosphatase
MTETGAIVRRVLVGGDVQGVGYREFTRRAALRLGVTGWVRNRSDGAVEALIRGPRAALEALIAEMRNGPRSAVVDNLSVAERDGDGDDRGAFVIRPTGYSEA